METPVTIRLAAASLLLLALPAFAQQPTAGIRAPAGDTLYWYEAEGWTSPPPLRLRLTAAPASATIELPGARIERVDPATGEFSATFDRIRVGITPLCVEVRTRARVARSCMVVVCEIPRMIDGIDNWGALEATVGALYNPSSYWLSRSFPPFHYYTTVEIDGVVRFESDGTIFRESQLPDSLMITERTRSVITRVYWRPAGTPIRSEWKLLAATNGRDNPAVPLESRGFNFDREK